MRRAIVRRALLAEMSVELILVSMVVGLLVFHGLKPASGQSQTGRSNDNGLQAPAPILL